MDRLLMAIACLSLVLLAGACSGTGTVKTDKEPDTRTPLISPTPESNGLADFTIEKWRRLENGVKKKR